MASALPLLALASISGLLLLYGFFAGTTGHLWLPVKHGWLFLSGASAALFSLAMLAWLAGSVILLRKKFTDRGAFLGLGLFAAGSLALIVINAMPSTLSCQQRVASSCSRG